MNPVDAFHTLSRIASFGARSPAEHLALADSISVLAGHLGLASEADIAADAARIMRQADEAQLTFIDQLRTR